MREFPRSRGCSCYVWRRLLPVLLLWLSFSSRWVRAESPEQANDPDVPTGRPSVRQLFGRDNLIAWCIVPFDSKKRGPEERAAMLQRLGFKHFAYDWRTEHIPTFDAEIEALKRHGVSLDAFWVAPGELNHESRLILDVLKRHKIKAQLWVILDLGADHASGPEQERRISAAVAKMRPLADEAKKIGCSLALYNHGGWFGEPENQVAIIRRLKTLGIDNVGMVYNLHHGHDHLARFPALLTLMKPYLVAINLNGMDTGGDKVGRKILPLGQGEHDLDLLKTILASGYHGPIGILGHTMDDAEARLRDNLDGLDWLLPQLEGKASGPPPEPRTPVPPRPSQKSSASTKADVRTITAGLSPEQSRELAELVDGARREGDAGRGAQVFLNPRFACGSCHKVGTEGGAVGPDLTTTGQCLSSEAIAESVLWPRRTIKQGYEAIAVSTDDGKVLQGYKEEDTTQTLVLREATTGSRVRIPRSAIEEVRALGSLMPEGLAATMSLQERRDLMRFLMDLGKSGHPATSLAHLTPHRPATFPFDRKPLQPDLWPHWQEPVNRERVYDFYAKEAEYFRSQSSVPMLLPQFPGLDGGSHGHWGNQSEETWADARWNQADLGTVLCGVFRGNGLTVPKGVCVRLGEHGEMSAVFNPETLSYEALWLGGFVRFSAVRHGFLDGLIMNGIPLPRPAGTKPEKPFSYHGFYRHGKRVVFAYRIGDEEFFDAPWVEGGKFQRVVAPARTHPLSSLVRGGPPQWPQVLTTRGPARPATSLRDRHDRAALSESLEDPALLRRS